MHIGTHLIDLFSQPIQKITCYSWPILIRQPKFAVFSLTHTHMQTHPLFKNILFWSVSQSACNQQYKINNQANTFNLRWPLLFGASLKKRLNSDHHNEKPSKFTHFIWPRHFLAFLHLLLLNYIIMFRFYFITFCCHCNWIFYTSFLISCSTSFMFWMLLLVINNSGSSRWTHLFLDMKIPQLTEPADNLRRDTRGPMLASVKPGNLRSASLILYSQAPCSNFICLLCFYDFRKLQNCQFRKQKQKKLQYQGFSISQKQSLHIFCVKCKINCSHTEFLYSLMNVQNTTCIAYLAIIGLHKA